MAINIQSHMARVVALEKEALAALTPTVPADAVPYFFHQGEAFPFFINRLGTITIDAEEEDFDLYEINTMMRLVIGHVTSGYKGEPDGKLQTWIPQILEYFNERELLQSVAFSDDLPYLERARIVSCTGFTVFNGIVGTSQVGAEFTLSSTFRYPITQEYL